MTSKISKFSTLCIVKMFITAINHSVYQNMQMFIN